MELNEFLKQCEDDDILCHEERLFKFKAIKEAISYTLTNEHISCLLHSWLSGNYSISLYNKKWLDGISASILKSDFKGWQQGTIKIKITLEFEPDQPEQPDSPLDEVRQEIINNQ